MTEDQISEAFELRVQTLAGSPTTIFENDPEDATVPRYDYSISFNTPNRVGLGKSHRIRGICTVAAVVVKGDHVTNSGPMAQAVVDLFWDDLEVDKFEFSGILITARPGVRGGFPDGQEYRVPVQILFEAPG